MSAPVLLRGIMPPVGAARGPSADAPRLGEARARELAWQRAMEDAGFGVWFRRSPARGPVAGGVMRVTDGASSARAASPVSDRASTAPPPTAAGTLVFRNCGATRGALASVAGAGGSGQRRAVDADDLVRAAVARAGELGMSARAHQEPSEAAVRPSEVAARAGDVDPGSRGAAGAGRTEREPLRVHAEWSDDGLRLWLGVDADVAPAAQLVAMSRELDERLAAFGRRLYSVVCNGRAVWPIAGGPRASRAAAAPRASGPNEATDGTEQASPREVPCR